MASSAKTPCSTWVHPARDAAAMASALWACTSVRRPSALASPQAASSWASVMVRAPPSRMLFDAKSLMRSAPACLRSRTFARSSSGPPEAWSRGSRGPGEAARLHGVAQVEVLGRPGALDGGDAGPERGPRVGGHGQRALRGRLPVVGGVELARGVEVPVEVVVRVDEAGQDGVPAEVMGHGGGGGSRPRRHRPDAAAPHGDPRVAGAPPAAVEERARPDDDLVLGRRHGRGGEEGEGDRAQAPPRPHRPLALPPSPTPSCQKRNAISCVRSSICLEADIPAECPALVS